MPLIQRSAIVAYGQRQMYELVNNIKDYPLFLPWCSQAEILLEQDDIIEASLEIRWAIGFHKKFATRNRLTPDERIDIQLLSGPFRHLCGHWLFTVMAPNACKVSLHLEFEFLGNGLDKLFQPVFIHIANTLVSAFCKRAIEVYGA